ncbi:MAG TPA: hypothetical protein VL996_03425 [Methylocella sp.]|nr:hypothetical protein [Methylocella sp.]
MSEDNEWQSVLENHPDHVRAIGMISIETANLEHAMAKLFAYAANIPLRLALAIYLTPKSAIARNEIFQSTVKAALRPRGTDDQQKRLRSARDKVIKIAERAKALIGKRHSIIHDAWGFNDETGEIQRYPFSNPITQQAVTLQDLESIIADFRKLISHANNLSDFLKKDRPTFVSMAITPRDKSPG